MNKRFVPSYTNLLLALLITVTAGVWVGCGQEKQELRRKIQDLEPVGDWIYDDIPLGFETAKKSGKPLMVVFRCVP